MILDRHSELLKASAISPEVAEARGYRSVETKAELRRLGFSDNQCRVPALLIPIFSVHGEVATYQARPDEPRISSQGKSVKYETPRGTRMVIDVPTGVRDRLGDPKVPLYITEGVRKADSAVSRGLASIDLLGVWNWRGTNSTGGKTALSDWELVALNGREIYIVFDSDVMEKPEVFQALSRLKGFLESRKAEVRAVYLPGAEGGEKVGLDDFFAAGGSPEDLVGLSSAELRSPPEAGPGEYEATEKGLVWYKPSRDGDTPVPLTNFTAEIVADVTHDDGVDTRREFEIVASLSGRETRISVPSSRFLSMDWVVDKLGAGAIITAGQSKKDRARCAIQHLSRDIEKRTVFSHTGWRGVGTEWLFLHAGGAIGTSGTARNLHVELPESLSRVRLPAPAQGDEARRALERDLALLEVFPDRLAIPLLAAVYRSTLGDNDLTVHLVGPSGVGKTEAAALAQQHFGEGLDSRHLPGSWSSTANSLEDLAFIAKDMLLVVDDFAPTGTQYDISRLHGGADRLLRGQGNRLGRQRMNRDGSLRSPRPPRGLILSTGEDSPRGQSLRARMVILEIGRDDINWESLSDCQRDAAQGCYARAMATFISWISAQRESITAAFRSETTRLRSGGFGSAGAHRRSVGNFASLAAAWEVYVRFAEEVGAIDLAVADALRERAMRCFEELSQDQSAKERSEDPV